MDDHEHPEIPPPIEPLDDEVKLIAAVTTRAARFATEIAVTLGAAQSTVDKRTRALCVAYVVETWEALREAAEPMFVAAACGALNARGLDVDDAPSDADQRS